MAERVEGRSEELLRAKNFGNVATIRKDGTPHLAVAWVDVDDGDVLLNSAEGRLWPENLKRDPRVSLTVPNLENPYEYVTIRGKVVEMTHEGADAHIDKLAKKYWDLDVYPLRGPGEQRVIVRIRPDRVNVWGGG
jgi:PPOX class probable F420-dependent enzyme